MTGVQTCALPILDNTNVAAGDAVNVNWNTTNSYTADLYHDFPLGTKLESWLPAVEKPTPSNSRSVVLNDVGTHSFSLIAIGSGGDIKCSTPDITVFDNTCPNLTATSSSVKQGDPVTLSWSGGENVSTITIKQKPTGSTESLAIINNVTVGGGSLEVIPSVTTVYSLDVIYTDDSAEVCPLAGIEVKVRPDQSGTEGPVPPN